jgi:hypothetical protein
MLYNIVKLFFTRTRVPGERLSATIFWNGEALAKPRRTKRRSSLRLRRTTSHREGSGSVLLFFLRSLLNRQPGLNADR